MSIKIASGFNRRLGYRHWNYTGMASIPFNTELGQVIGLDVVPATDGSGNYVPVVAIQNAADITLAGFTLPDLEAQIGPGTPPAKMLVGGLVYNADPPTVSPGQTVAFQGDSAGNLKGSVENSEIAVGPVSQEGTWVVGLDEPLPPGTNSIGQVTANAGTNLNTSALALESGGNLATIAGTVVGGKVRVDPSVVTSPVSVASLPLPEQARP